MSRGDIDIHVNMIFTLLTFDDANWVGGGKGEIDVLGGDFKGFL